jgi:hypothetical protein
MPERVVCLLTGVWFHEIIFLMQEISYDARTTGLKLLLSRKHAERGITISNIVSGTRMRSSYLVLHWEIQHKK